MIIDIKCGIVMKLVLIAMQRWKKRGGIYVGMQAAAELRISEITKSERPTATEAEWNPSLFSTCAAV